MSMEDQGREARVKRLEICLPRPFSLVPRLRTTSIERGEFIGSNAQDIQPVDFPLMFFANAPDIDVAQGLHLFFLNN